MRTISRVGITIGFPSLFLLLVNALTFQSTTIAIVTFTAALVGVGLMMIGLLHDLWTH